MIIKLFNDVTKFIKPGSTENYNHPNKNLHKEYNLTLSELINP